MATGTGTVRRRLAGWLPAAVLLLAAEGAMAFGLFGLDGRSRAVNYLRRADATLTHADKALEDGQTTQALALYERAEKAYVALDRDHPELHDGLPRIRLAYCRDQIRRIREGLAGGAAPPVPAAVREDAAPVPAPAGAGAASLPSAVSAAVVSVVPSTSAVPAVAVVPADRGRPVAADLAEARALLAEERHEDVVRLLSRVLQEDPGNRSARLMVALARAGQGRGDEALAALEDLRGREEDLPLLLALAAACHVAGRDFDAMLALDQAIRLAPDHPHAYVDMAWLSLSVAPGAQGREEAEAYYRQALRLGARRDRRLERRLGLGQEPGATAPGSSG
jgi:tetratricopeptide (TPR) repeat protein